MPHQKRAIGTVEQTGDANRDYVNSSMTGMMNRKKRLTRQLAILAGVSMFCTVPYAAEESSEMDAWKVEFERICSQTKIAVSLEQEQLLELVSDSRKHLKVLNDLDDPEAKIYIFRLEKCKVFFEYARELKADW